LTIKRKGDGAISDTLTDAKDNMKKQMVEKLRRWLWDITHENVVIF
jgi:hypothetical protein